MVTAEACPAGGYACNPHGNCSFVWNQGIAPGCSLCSLGSSGRLCSKCHCDQVRFVRVRVRVRCECAACRAGAC